MSHGKTIEDQLKIKAIGISPNLQRYKIRIHQKQAILLTILFGIVVPFLTFTVTVALFNTLIIFLLISSMGLWLCHQTRNSLDDNGLNILGTFWLLKVGITLFLLYFGWMPQLDPSSANWGYDPQRFYVDAWDLIENGWNPLAGSNYQGIIFYYGAIFYLFGHNPVIPALINAFVTLVGILFLIRCSYSFMPDRTNRDWTIAGLLLVPEVLWYDVMTSRETLMAVLIIIAILSVGRYLVGIKYASFPKTIFIAGSALFVILAVRTSMAIPVVVSIGVMLFLLRSKKKLPLLFKVLMLSLFAIGLSLGPLIQNVVGGTDFNFLELINSVQSFEANTAASTLEWGENSIGLLIKPNNLLEALIFLPIRMVLYLAAPLPNVAVSITELSNGNISAWQSLMTIPTSLLMIFGLPYALAGLSQAWSFRRNQPAPLILHIAFWVVFAAVAGGNIIIHERYRVMFTLLLFTCVWCGYTRCSYIKVRKRALPWFCFIGAFGLFYLSYKLIR